MLFPGWTSTHLWSHRGTNLCLRLTINLSLILIRVQQRESTLRLKKSEGIEQQLVHHLSAEGESS